MERARDLRPEQKRMFYQLMLTMLVSATVALFLHKPEILFGMLACSWMVSILTFGQPGYVRITCGVLVMGILYYVLYRFVFHAA